MSRPDIPVHDSLDDARDALERPVVPIGNFDGVHIGHRAIFDRANAIAEKAKPENPPVVGLTFRPHPVRFFKPDADDFRLMSDPQKFHYMGAAGLDAVVALPFDRDTADKPPEVFVQTILADGLAARHVVVGSTFRFGKNRAGSTEDLRRLCAELDIGCDVLDELTHDGEVISSTRIRDLLADGDVGRAATLLGRPYALSGPVVSGAGRGRDLGYPTANIDPENPVLVPHGVYASRIKWNGQRHLAATSIGVRPTFDDDDAITVEAFVLDAPDDFDLYDRHVELQIDDFLRPELAFDSPQELVEQMDEDVSSVRAYYERQ